MGAQLVREVATKTNDVAGDGTADRHPAGPGHHPGRPEEPVTAGANPMVMRKGIEKAVAAAVDAIKANSVAVIGQRRFHRQSRHRVLRRRDQVGKLIAEAMEKVGTAEGVISVEESKTADTTLEVVEGMQFDRGYISPYMITDTDKMEAVIDDRLYPDYR